MNVRRGGGKCELFDCRHGGRYCMYRCCRISFNVRKGVMQMVEAMLFMVGFTGITTIYEIVKTTKSTKSNSVRREAERIGRKFK